MSVFILMKFLVFERDCMKRNQTGLEVTQSFAISLLAVGEPMLFLTPAPPQRGGKERCSYNCV